MLLLGCDRLYSVSQRAFFRHLNLIGRSAHSLNKSSPIQNFEFVFHPAPFLDFDGVACTRDCIYIYIYDDIARTRAL